jgi:hypothetical protein
MLTFNWITFFINLLAIFMCGSSSVINFMEANYPIAALMAVLSLVNVAFAIQTFQRINSLRDEK